LTIQSVTVNKAAAKFESKGGRLIVPLASAAKTGQKFDVEIKYEGKPTKGLYSFCPIKIIRIGRNRFGHKANRKIRVLLADIRLSERQADDGNDFDRTSGVDHGGQWKLIGVTDAGNGNKTWTWRENLPSSTYLITVVAGEFDEVKETWRGIPVTYYAPKGRGDRLK